MLDEEDEDFFLNRRKEGRFSPINTAAIRELLKPPAWKVYLGLENVDTTGLPVNVIMNALLERERTHESISDKEDE